MSFGGSVSAMISSLSNNRLLLKSMKSRRNYARDLHPGSRKKEKPKARIFSSKKIAAIKQKNRKQYIFETRRRRVILLGLLILTIIGFFYLFHFLNVI